MSWALRFFGRPDRGFWSCRGSPHFSIRWMVAFGTQVRSLITEYLRWPPLRSTRSFALWEYPIQYWVRGATRFYLVSWSLVGRKVPVILTQTSGKRLSSCDCFRLPRWVPPIEPPNPQRTRPRSPPRQNRNRRPLYPRRHQCWHITLLAAPPWTRIPGPLYFLARAMACFGKRQRSGRNLPLFRPPGPVLVRISLTWNWWSRWGHCCIGSMSAYLKMGEGRCWGWCGDGEIRGSFNMFTAKEDGPVVQIGSRKWPHTLRIIPKGVLLKKLLCNVGADSTPNRF